MLASTQNWKEEPSGRMLITNPSPKEHPIEKTRQQETKYEDELHVAPHATNPIRHVRSNRLPSLRSNSLEEGEDDTYIGHTLEDYNMEGITHRDHNFASLRGFVVLRIRGAAMGDWMMGASKVGICVCMVTHT